MLRWCNNHPNLKQLVSILCSILDLSWVQMDHQTVVNPCFTVNALRSTAWTCWHEAVVVGLRWVKISSDENFLHPNEYTLSAAVLFFKNALTAWNVTPPLCWMAPHTPIFFCLLFPLRFPILTAHLIELPFLLCHISEAQILNQLEGVQFMQYVFKQSITYDPATAQ